MDARRQSTADGSEALAYVVEHVDQPDGTSGPRKGPGPVAPAEGSARPSGGAGGSPLASLVPEWATTREGMRSHLADKTCRSAVERSVRLHGKRLGRTYLDLAAERLVGLDAPQFPEVPRG